MTGDIVVIYVDTLIFVNIIVDYLLLKLTALLTKRKYSSTRLVIAAIIGGFSSLYILVHTDNILLDIAFKMVVASVLIMTLQGLLGFKAFLCSLGIFVLLSFALNGFVVALENIFNKTFFTENMINYFNISSLHLIFFTAVIYAVIMLVRKITDKSLSGYRADLKITVCGYIMNLKGFVDTGNHLRDPFSNLPVIVINKENYDKILVAIGSIEVSRRKRLVPFSTINERGVLNALRCDSVEISIEESGRYDYKDIIIASASQKINNGFDAIVPLRAVDRISDKR